MKEVYIVVSSLYDYEGCNLEGIFDSLNKAKKLQDQLMKKAKKDKLD